MEFFLSRKCRKMIKDYELIKFNDLEVMPWKNGQGNTRELDIYPKNSKLSRLDFKFRISMAQISAPNEFSLFPGFSRILTVIKGDGILINDYELLNKEIFKFNGDDKIVSSLLNPLSEVIDLGIIFDSKFVNVSFEKIESSNPFQMQINALETTYLILLAGKFSFNGHQLTFLDTIKFYSENQIAIPGDIELIKIAVRSIF